MSTEQVKMMESQNLNSVSFAENESMNENVTNRSNGRRIGFLRRKIVELQAELDTLLALEPVKVSKIGKGYPKAIFKGIKMKICHLHARDYLYSSLTR